MKCWVELNLIKNLLPNTKVKVCPNASYEMILSLSKHLDLNLVLVELKSDLEPFHSFSLKWAIPEIDR